MKPGNSAYKIQPPVCLRIVRIDVTRFIYKQRFFQLILSGLNLSWIELSMLLKCCLIYISIIIRRNFFYLVYLSLCLSHASNYVEIIWSFLYFHYGYRSSHRRCSIRKCVLRNFAKFAGKYMCQSLFFNKVAVFRVATFFKKRLWHRCFPVNFVRFLRAPFLHPRATASTVNHAISLKQTYFFFCTFLEICLTIFRW